MTPVLEARFVPSIVAPAFVVALVVVVPDIVAVEKSAVAVSACLLVVAGCKFDPGNIPASSVVAALVLVSHPLVVVAVVVVDPNRPVVGHPSGTAVAVAPFEVEVTLGRPAVVVAQKGIVAVQDRRPQLDLLNVNP